MLRETLNDWRDWDGAAFLVARALEIIRENTSFQESKSVSWANNPVGNALFEILDLLVSIGVLQKREEPDTQYRWNPDFRGRWE